MEASEGFYTVQAGSGGGDRQPSPGFAAMRTAQVRIGIGARELTVIDGRIHVPTRDDAVAGAAQAAPKALFVCPPPPTPARGCVRAPVFTLPAGMASL